MLNLTPAQSARVQAAGLRLSGLAKTGHLHPSSWVEGPTAIHATVPAGSILRLGAFCNLSGSQINNAEIGRYCSIAKNVVIGTHEHPTNWLTSSRTAYFPQVNGWDRLMAGEDAPSLQRRKRPFPGSCPVTVLGPDVWIGEGAFIKSGITIGAGAIIGARATVVKDVPPYAIVVGTPGRVLRLRFPEPVVERLLALEWWRFSIYDLFDAPFDDIERAIDAIGEMAASGAVTPYQGPVFSAEDLADPDRMLQVLDGSPLALAS
ncbi:MULTISPECIES: CatB-related O-acetyltransferase [Rhodovulum]|uniref:Transferase family hexapeptide repeat protein n=2 Tax=Rhodovulum TaxID=34008 RepID=A0A8E2VHD0_9RHOB|nr:MULTISPECIES: CatB-related O-acetyltransferase [Rhodovulum]PTW44162.1 transferase family hexapeptide repeat protein [Rhodovulum kholense]RAP39485.1 acetyltransferase [Rhodovulum viride]